MNTNIDPAYKIIIDHADDIDDCQSINQPPQCDDNNKNNYCFRFKTINWSDLIGFFLLIVKFYYATKMPSFNMGIVIVCNFRVNYAIFVDYHQESAVIDNNIYENTVMPQNQPHSNYNQHNESGKIEPPNSPIHNMDSFLRTLPTDSISSNTLTTTEYIEFFQFVDVVPNCLNH
ncbi:hypothetical protein DLAC_11111 [Tieghemostelium lacteum]|uniref:Uncharacterized protein n=1 Tax=Tieghemostelium lacteum TaxID=361077 RepID=A0A151Z381_TIELA|nr:hypothetical protein DLAC_11111 [Tieghemostelium lacteum]|eukprot:KYQ88410.1 hypothetical protein DLAC_11111 [Tieghemostelium lacteum]